MADSGWPCELGSLEIDNGLFQMKRESLDVGRRYYKKYLSQQEHRNFICHSDPPIVISIESRTHKIDGSVSMYR